MAKPKSVHVLMIAFLVMLALSGCSSSTTTLNVNAKDIKFGQTSWDAPAGGEVTLNLKNDGALEHEFVIMKSGTEVTVPFDEDDEANIYWEIKAKPGETASGVFTAPAEAGEYQVVCGIAGHVEAGMTGVLIVK